MGIMCSRSFLERGIHYIPGSGLVYIQNAKAACSSVKKTMWLSLSDHPYDEDRGPHERTHAPFCRTLEDVVERLDPFLASTFFSIVRNPYTRILAAYLDKVGSACRDTGVWFPFASRHRLSGDDRPSFPEFLRLMVQDELSVLDQHFAPQYVNTASAFLSLDAIVRMELPHEIRAFMRRHGMAMKSHQPHSTWSAQRLAEMYGADEIRLVAEYYARDFELFGYSTDPTLIEPTAPARRRSLDRGILRSLIGIHTEPDPDQRRRCIAGVAADVSEFDIGYAYLDSGLLDDVELQATAEACIRNGGAGRNWRYLARLAEELLRRDYVFEAASVASLARIVRHGE